MSKRRLHLLVLIAALLGALLVPVTSPTSVGAAPTEAPTSLVPDGNAFSANPTLSWSALPGVGLYRVQIDDNEAFSSPFTIDTVQTTFAPYTQLPKGTTYWRVAGNQSGLGPYSNTASFTIDLAGPTPTSPSNGSVLEYPNEPAAFTWTPLPGARSYEFEHDDAPDFIGAVKITSETNGAILVGTPPFGQLNYWRVRANYSGGAQSEWSSPGTYTLQWPDQLGKGKPTLVKPANSTAPANALTDIELEWEPLVGAESYILQVNRSSDFSGDNVFTGEVYGVRYSPPTTWENDEYFWRVRGSDKNNNLGPWSETRGFVRNWPSPVSGLPGVANPPTLVSPVNDAVAPDPMHFVWQPVDRAAFYEIQVGTDPAWSDGTFSNCFTVHTSLFPYDPTTTSGEPGGCAVFTSEGAPKGSYWRVRGIDAPKNILGLWSETRHFTFEPFGGATADPLTAATQTFPPDCAAGDCEVASTPELRWDKVPGASYYQLYIAEDAQFTTVVSRYTVPASDFPRMQPREELPDNDAGGAYYWHVRPCDSVGLCTLDPQGQANPPRRAFQKRSAAPVPVGPGIPFDPSNPPPDASIPVVTEMPRFEWEDYLESAAGDVGARQYRLFVSTTPQMNDLVENGRNVDQTFYSAFDRTYPEGPLYWQVAAIDASNNVRKLSAVHAFKYESDAPQLLSPADAATLNGTPQFTWEGIPFARSYQFELYKNGDEPISSGNRIDNRETMFSDFTPYDSLAPGVYAWRVQRYDGQGRKGPWSELHKFTVTGYAPDLTAPPAGVTLTDHTTFAWEYDGIGQPSRFRFQRSATPDFAAIAEQRDTAMFSWAPIAIVPNGTWYWRVLALNGDDEVMGTSATRTFIQNTPNLPSAPQNLTITPSSGALTVTWKAPSKAGAPAFTEYVITVNPGAIQITVPKATLTRTINGLINGTTYDVTVSAKSVDGTSLPAVGSGQPNGCDGTPFKDVPSSHPFCVEIAWMYDSGLSTGSIMGDGSVLYRPSDAVSRQAMAAFLYRYDGSPAVNPTQFFGDVPPTSPFYNDIQWMGQSGLSTGTPNPPGKPLYKPVDKVSRQAMGAFLHRYAGNLPPGLPSQFFADVPPSSPFYNDIQWMADSGLSTGTPNPPGKPLYKPVDPVSRQAMAAFLYRFDQTMP